VTWKRITPATFRHKISRPDVPWGGYGSHAQPAVVNWPIRQQRLHPMRNKDIETVQWMSGTRFASKGKVISRRFAILRQAGCRSLQMQFVTRLFEGGRWTFNRDVE
jgi:hypothetical protein